MKTSNQQITKLLADRLWRMENGYVYKIRDRNGNVVPFVPNTVQKRFLANMRQKNIVLKARQTGLTTLSALLLLDEAVFRENRSCGIIAHDLESAEHIFTRIVRFAYQNMPEWIMERTERTVNRNTEMCFETLSRIAVDTSFR